LNGSGTNSGLGNQQIWANGQRSQSNSISFNGINADNLFNGATSSSVSSNRFVLSTGEQGFGPNGDIITGTSVYDAIGQGIPTPPPETIDEIQVSTSMYDASQGAKSGAHIEVVTKSGTNQFHGQAYEYFQNNFWDAAPFFYNADSAIPQDQKVPEKRRNTFGGLVGGPIKRDKAFFFASYQGTRVKDQLNGTQFVTVPLQLTDDRSAAGLAAVASAQTGSTVTAGQINSAAMNIMNAKLPDGQYLVPSPTITDPATALNLGYDAVINGPPATFAVDQFNGNIDYNFSSTDRLAGKYFYQRNPTITPFPPDGELLGFPQTLHGGSQAISLTNTRVLGPTATWALRGGFMREGAFAKISQPLTAQDAGINLFGQTRFPGIRIRSGDSTLGNELDIGTASPFANAGMYQNQFEGGTDLNWVRGKHTFSFGADYMRTQLNILNQNNEVATIQNSNFADFLQGTLRSGTTLFVGESNRYYRANNLGLYAQDKIKVTPNLTVDVGLRFDYNGPLFEKYGRLTNFDPSRYQYDLATDTVVDTGLVIAGNYPQYGTKGVSDSTLTANQFGFAPRLGLAWSPSFVKNVVVRAGFGMYYDRGEYFYEFSPSAGSGFNGPFGVTLEPPFVLQVPHAQGATLEAPFGSTPPAQPTGNPSDFAQFVPNQSDLINYSGPSGGEPFLFGGYDAANKLPYSTNWELDFQWQPRNDLVLTLGYTGNHGNHLLAPIPFNQPKIAIPGNAVNGQTYSYGYNPLDSSTACNGGGCPLLSQTVPGQPFYAINTYDGGNTDLRAPYIGYSTSSVLYEAEAVSNYNALQFSATKRLSHGLQINGSYTWSHSLDEDSGLGLFFNGNDPFNLPSAYGSSDFDRTHVFIISYLYQFPHLNLTGAANQILNGWGISGVTTLESGQPYAVYDYSGGVASIYYGGGNDYLTNPLLAFAPGYTAQKAKLQGTTGVDPGKPVLDPSAFTIPLVQPGQNGVPPCGPTFSGATICDSYETGFSDQGRNLFRGPFQQRFDFAVQKLFQISERWQLQYRADFFNLFNQPSFDTPNNNISFNPYYANPPIYGPGTSYNACVPSTGAYACPPAGALGVIQHTLGSPRFIQMSLHLIF
jgi:outer membrane receptor protein involved in Fe transport